MLDDSSETSEILCNKTICESHAIKGCGLNIRYANRERKVIDSPSSDNIFVLTIIQDISEQKERELELLQAKTNAQTAVATRELFLATMSHELRTPIAGVHGLLDLLGHKLSDTQHEGLINQAQRSIHHLNQLVDEVLDYSQLEAGQLHVQATNTDLFSMLQESVLTFAPQAESKGLRYLIEIEPLRAPVLPD